MSKELAKATRGVPKFASAEVYATSANRILKID
jgi:hypothetical protein